MKKLFTLFLVLATTFVLVGCGSSGGSSGSGSNNPLGPGTSYITEELLISTLGSKKLDIELEIEVAAKGGAANMVRASGAATYKAIIYKLSNDLVKDSAIKYELNNLTEENGFINATMSFDTSSAVLKQLFLSKLYEIEVFKADKPILKAIIPIDYDTKYNKLLKEEKLDTALINDETTAQVLYIEKLLQTSKITTYESFTTTYKDEDLNDIIGLINEFLSDTTGINTLYDDNGSFNHQLENEFNRKIVGGYVVTGSISGGAIPTNPPILQEGVGYQNLYYVIALEKNGNEWKTIKVNNETVHAIAHEDSRSYTLVIPNTGTYKLQVVNFNTGAVFSESPVFETEEFTLAVGGSGKVLNIIMPGD
jgi:hypothetical protein